MQCHYHIEKGTLRATSLRILSNIQVETPKLGVSTNFIQSC